MNRRSWLNVAAGAAASNAFRTTAAGPDRPDIVLILADDLGYSDLGCFGGEIQTPNLDRLAARGVRFTQFYNNARCCPSRAALLTGVYPHRTGMGNMVGGTSTLPGYTGKLSRNYPLISEVLRQSGYKTLMAGKWHLGQPSPVERGFDEYYGLLGGFDSCWDESKYTRLPAGRPKITYPPGGFYATRAITDHALSFVQEARNSERPYFLYLAYNAPHFPLHAWKGIVDRYVPLYRQGWDSIRSSRFTRMKNLGLVDSRWDFTPRSVIPPNTVATLHGWDNKQNPAWSSLASDRREDLARRMAIYAAMVDIMDYNIGRLLDDIERSPRADNTVIVFLSDNGACAEWDPFGFDTNTGPNNILHKGAELERMGQPGTYHSYGSGWANACATPFRLYKHFTHEGGITTPFIVAWNKGLLQRNVLTQQCGHVIDILPTFAELAGATLPVQMDGISLVPAFQGGSLQRGALFFEHEGNRAVRSGKWKLVARGPEGPWQLYDMEADRTEMHNLAAQRPDLVKALSAQWREWAEQANVLPWPWN